MCLHLLFRSLLWLSVFSGCGLCRADSLWFVTGSTSIMVNPGALDPNAPRLTPSMIKLASEQIAALGEPLTLTPTMASEGSFTFRWWREGMILPGQTGASLVISNVQPSDAGTYQVEVIHHPFSVFSNLCEVAVFEERNGEHALRDDQSIRLAARVWGRASIRWEADADSHDLQHPMIFGRRTPTLTVASGRYIDADREVTLSAWVEFPYSSNVQLMVKRRAARYVLRAIHRSPRLLGVDDQDYQVGQNPAAERVAFSERSLLSEEIVSSLAGREKLSARGLPPGLSVDPEGMQLKGAFTQLGQYRVTWHLADDQGRQSAALTTLMRVSAGLLTPKPGLYAGIVAGSEQLEPLKQGGYVELQVEPSGSFSGVLRLADATRRLAGKLKPLPLTEGESFEELDLPILPLKGTRTTTVRLRTVASALPPEVEIRLRHLDDREEILTSALRFRPLFAAPVGEEQMSRYSGLLELRDVRTPIFPPTGTGFMSLSMNRQQTAMLIGTLADGTALTGSCPVLPDAEWLKMPFFQHQSTTGRTLSGEFAVDQVGRYSLTGELEWRQAARVGNRLYPEGFHAVLAVLGGRYVMPPSGCHLLSELADVPDNAALLSENLLDPVFFRLTAGHQAKLPVASVGGPRLGRLDFYAPTGLFTGEIILEGLTTEVGRRLPRQVIGFRGMMIPHLHLGAGFYLIPEQVLQRVATSSRGQTISKSVEIRSGF